MQKKSDDNQLLKLGNRNRWDADGKIIYDLSRAQYDDEAVTLRQMKDITDKKIDTDVTRNIEKQVVDTGLS